MFLTRPASRKSLARQSKSAVAKRRRKMFFESLEARQLLATIITFSETQQYDGNSYLISSDGEYRVEALPLPSGHFHISNLGGPGGNAEYNHNNDGSQGVRIFRLDGGTFSLEQMDLYGQAAIGVSSFTLYNGSGTQAAPGVLSFGGAFTGLTEIRLRDPSAAGGSSSSNAWDNIVLENFPGQFTPVAPDPRTEVVPFVDITFDDPINAGTFDWNDLDLTLNGGADLMNATVTVTPQGGNTYRIGNLAGLTVADGDYKISIIGAGIDDAGAVPLLGVGHDKWITRHALAPLVSVAPAGSLIYDPVETRGLPAVTDVQNLQIALDAGHKFSVVITPSGTLQPAVNVINPASASIGSATAAGAGQEVVLRNLNASAAGTYQISVATAGGTTGTFTIQVFLNADVESEQHGGASNDTLGTAQNIDASFFNITTGGAQRGAVIGEVSPPFTLVGSDQSDRFVEVNRTTGAATTIATGVNSNRGYTDLARNPVTGVLYGSGAQGDSGFYSINPATGAGTLIGNPGTLHSLAWSPDGTTLFAVRNFSDFGTVNAGTGAFTFMANAPTRVHGMAFHPVTGVLYAVPQNGQLHTVDTATGVFTFVGTHGQTFLSLEFLADGTLLGSAGGSLFSIDPATGTATFIGSTGVGTLIGLEGLPPIGSLVDYFSFTLAIGQTTTLALDGDSVILELLNSGGGVLATGTSASNLDQVISDFAAPATGTYYARLTRASGQGEYHLAVTKDAAFDTESNRQSTPQAIGAVNTVLGFAPQGMPFVMAGGPSGLFAMTGAAGSTSTLYELDPLTGQIVQTIGPTGFTGITGMDFDPTTGQMFATGGVAGNSPPLMTLDLGTGAGTLIGGTGNFTDISIDPNGVIYGYGDTHNFPGDDVYNINPADGSFVLVGSPGHYVSALHCHS